MNENLWESLGGIMVNGALAQSGTQRMPVRYPVCANEDSGYTSTQSGQVWTLEGRPETGTEQMFMTPVTIVIVPPKS